jgi:exopolysaccharide biosynthesis polyprenyl glycosylphosphotransferase
VSRSRLPLALLLALADAALVAASFLASWFLRFRLEVGKYNPDGAPLETYLKPLGLIVVVFLVVFWARGLYETGLASSLAVQTVERTLRASSLASVVVLATFFFYRESSYSRSALLYTWLLTSALLPLPRILLVAWQRRRRRAGRGLEPALIVGTLGQARELESRIGDRARFGLDLVGFVEPPGAPADGERSPSPERLGTLAHLGGVLRSHAIREVLIACELPKNELIETIATCEALDVEIRAVPPLYDLYITAEDLLDLDGTPFIAIRERRLERASLALKRAFDLVSAAVLLVLSAPVLAACMVAIRLESEGPALFSQIRTGEGGRLFRMWKLRTMVRDAEARLRELVDVERLAEPVFKLEKDPRVTRVGAFLRRTSLDELPQLWNVVRGEMSLVGPRPEEEKIVARYNAHQRRRLKAKPGITGLQQVEARGGASLEDRIRLDVLYIRRRTFLLDLWILARTLGAVISGRGAR